MTTHTRLRLLGILLATGALTFGAAPAFAAPGRASYTCTGGDIPSGTYADVTVTGACAVADGAVITVTGNVTVSRNAALDAQSAPATLTVGHNVTAAAGSFLGLGCQPPAQVGNSAHECAENPDGHSVTSVGGNVTATDPAAVLVNGATIGGNVTVTGGGSPVIPWSIKNNTIGRNVTVTGPTTTWLGVMFNRVAGNVTLHGIAVTDDHPGAPGLYVVRNTIGHNLTCTGITPGVSGGFDTTPSNIVAHRAVGQCAGLAAP